MDHSIEIIASWEANAGNWIGTIENAELESRVLATNEAIVNAVMDQAAKKVLDIGCGEGWLTRKLRSKGIEAYGADAIAGLIDYAIEKDGNHYWNYSYQEIANGVHDLPAPFDLVVINFALIDKNDTEKLIAALPSLLKTEGRVVIQTLHPFSMAAAGDYSSGWKDGSWNGLQRPFTQPYQWYFRTMEDWIGLFAGSGFAVSEVREPLHPQTQKPLSVIFILRIK